MTAPAAPQAFTNVRILTDDDKEQIVIPPDAPMSETPIAEEALASDPGHYVWLFRPGTPSRPANDAERADYAARRSAEDWKWLYDVAEATKAPPLPAPVAAPEPAPVASVNLPTEPVPDAGADSDVNADVNLPTEPVTDPPA